MTRHRVETYEDLVAAFKAERHGQGLSGEALDALAGLQERYTAKLENPGAPWGKKLGSMSLPALLGALGLEMRDNRGRCYLDSPPNWHANYATALESTGETIYVCRRAEGV